MVNAATRTSGVLQRLGGRNEFDSSGLGVLLTGQEGAAEVLADIDLSVQPGEFVSIVGASGTGKTTLLRVLGGLQPFSRGVLAYRGSPVTGPPSGVVIVFQDYVSSLLRWRTVWRNVALGVEKRRKGKDWAVQVDEALALVGLSHVATEYPWRLSGGMQQRVQIARALAVQPSALLMDEPFGALDALTKAALQDELLRVREATGATIIFVTHDVDEAVYLSDRVLVLAGRPATITAEIPVGLPRPRDQVITRELPDYLRCRRNIAELLQAKQDSP